MNATSHQPTDGPNQPKDGPARTCVGCRTVAPQADLLRIAVAGDRLVADPRRRLAGRGAYVHRAAACLAAAGKGGLARAFKRSVSRADLDAIAAGASGAAPAGNRARFAVETAATLASPPTATTAPATASAVPPASDADTIPGTAHPGTTPLDSTDLSHRHGAHGA
ncbi:MAG: YlxR family protein [Kofleriaceae bacterium]|nr:YlxR family protein [Kofleriaceae bacterium]MBP9170987.1 YlxR family protein [Kofleriaceae bacterium]MBP9860628.1 YlxR family protein [Kofleriaceae bacterium]